jgi:hypothetical protein
MTKRSSLVTGLTLAVTLAHLGGGCVEEDRSAKAPRGVAALPTPDPAPAIAKLKGKVDQFVPADLAADTSNLSEADRTALGKLIDAAKLLDPVFDRQAWAGNPDLDKQLKADESEMGKLRYEYFRIMRGPWDRQDHFKAFAVEKSHPKGAGFYPEDMTEEEFRKWVKEHPEDKAEFESLFTVISRENGKLVATPYSKAYAEWLEPSAKELRNAADQTGNESLKIFLRARAEAFLNDDYYESDKAWMDLDSPVEITIGPYETYEDHLLGLKAAFEAFVTVVDPDASKDLDKFKKYLPEMEQHLPVPNNVKTTRGRESPIRVADLVFSSGDARKSVQTIAFNLPNDERVRAEKGAKKVLLRNSIQTKFDKIMKPIGEAIMDPSHHAHLSSEAFFQQVLFHELSHSLGPAFTRKGGKKVEVRVALGPAYMAIEECKADAMGAYNILFMVEKGEFPEDFRDKLLVSYFAGLFRSVRFGVAEAHGRGAAIQLNRYMLEEAAIFDAKKSTFKLDADKLAKSIEKLVHDLVMLQHDGDSEAAEKLLNDYGVVSPPMEQTFTKLKDIPVDIRPIYPVARENAPR